VWGKRLTPEKRRERLVQETLIKPNLVYWTGLGLILGKALASVSPPKRLAALSVDVTEITDIWGIEDLSKYISVIFKSTAELIGPYKGAGFGDEFAKLIRVVKRPKQDAFIRFW